MLPEEVVLEDEHRGRPLVVAGPHSAPGAAASAVDDALSAAEAVER